MGQVRSQHPVVASEQREASSALQIRGDWGFANGPRTENNVLEEAVGSVAEKAARGWERWVWEAPHHHSPRPQVPRLPSAWKPRLQPHSRARQIPTEKDAFDATIIVGAVNDQLVLAQEKARAIASPDLDIALQILTKVVPLQATPGRRAASHSPIIVEVIEMF
eukprot:3913869-Rhodomonas_salina.1